MNTPPITWLHPSACDPPHRVARPWQVAFLSQVFAKHGWGIGEPALVGYRFMGRVQLLSGSHRWAAARESGIDKIPVVIWEYESIHSAWGVDMSVWSRIMSPPTVERVP